MVKYLFSIGSNQHFSNHWRIAWYQEIIKLQGLSKYFNFNTKIIAVFEFTKGKSKGQINQKTKCLINEYSRLTFSTFLKAIYFVSRRFIIRKFCPYASTCLFIRRCSFIRQVRECFLPIKYSKNRIKVYCQTW